MSTRTRSRQEEKRVRILYYPGVIDEAAMDVHSVSSYHVPPQPIRCLVPRHHDEETFMQSVDFGGV